MKRVLSVRGALVVALLLVAALSAGTALAGRQGAVSPQMSLERPEGATIVTSSMCIAPIAGTKAAEARKTPAKLTVWGSGWAPAELILISVIRDTDNVNIWYSGTVNAAGASEIKFEILSGAWTYPSSEVRPLAPPAGIYTLEALGTSGRLATYPIIVVADKCP